LSPRRQSTLTAEIVRSLLIYDHDTGNLIWKVNRHGTAKAGMVASRKGWGGYNHVKIFGLTYYASSVVWLHQHGAWPSNQIDHRNTNRSDDRLANLREATPSQNAANRRRPGRQPLPRGVSLLPSGRFRASVKIAGKKKHLGVFDSPDAAHAAFVVVAKAIHGEFLRTS